MGNNNTQNYSAIQKIIHNNTQDNQQTKQLLQSRTEQWQQLSVEWRQWRSELNKSE